MEKSDIPRQFQVVHTVPCNKCGTRLTFYSDRRFQDSVSEQLEERAWLPIHEGKFLCSNCRLVAGAED